MVKRFGWKRYAYLGFALLMLLVSWESSRANAMLFAGEARADSASGIPAESIRLRILANSDTAADQWIKREVRDAIIEQMNGWVTAPDGIEAARAVVRQHLPELEATVGQTLREHGFDYAYTVELGIVPFPTKMYGNQVYPAGDYEALRVSIGAAEGQNWWCVLFPPLCFVDSEMVVKKKNKAEAASPEEEERTEKDGSSSSDKKQAEAPAKKMAVAKDNTKTAKAEGSAVKAASGTEKSGKNNVQADIVKAGGVASADEPGAAKKVQAESPEKPEVRFFLWELITQVVSWFA
ncbi:stage II sporulation protein R [Paenibacillus puerhi]|uniref:stage II sporulation protein R n=1 Tax=Paenibacillus puerhi TaxID=2692622 RepID=UPI00135B711C|nr:stage II sporulation protein R [Paenibacillus puerhi]